MAKGTTPARLQGSKACHCAAPSRAGYGSDTYPGKSALQRWLAWAEHNSREGEVFALRLCSLTAMLPLHDEVQVCTWLRSSAHGLNPYCAEAGFGTLSMLISSMLDE